MSITLRQITSRADGSEIVRSQRLDADQATIGRAEESDIVLPDLALRLIHARLRLTGDEVTVEGEAGARFKKDGRAVSRASFQLEARTALGFGDFVLTVEPGLHECEALITVTTREGAGAEDLDQAAKVFSLAGGLVGKRVLAWALGLVILAVAVATPVLFFGKKETIFSGADAQWSAGHLSQAHAFLEADCESCHQQAFVAVRDEACMSCHAKVADEAVMVQAASRVKAAGSPYPPLFVREHAAHARLVAAMPPPTGRIERLRAMVRKTVKRQDDRCASCHLEHQGPEMTPATIGDVAMEARPPIPLLREVNTCVSCHTGMAARLKNSPLVDAPSWDHHPQFRPLVTLDTRQTPVRIAPVRMTQPVVENTGLVFPHALHLSANGGVARMAQGIGRYGGALECGSCHEPDPAGTGFLPVTMERACEACHSLALGDQPWGPVRLPHGEPAQVTAAIRAWFGGPRPVAPTVEQARRRPGDTPQLERQEQRQAARAPDPGAASRAITAAFSPKGVCFDCHVIGQSGGGFTVTPVKLPSRYLFRGTFDHRTIGHHPDQSGGPACGSCHQAQTSDRASDLLLPTVAVCATCHGKPKGAVVHAPSGDCASCHSFHAPVVPTRPTRRQLALKDDGP